MGLIDPEFACSARSLSEYLSQRGSPGSNPADWVRDQMPDEVYAEYEKALNNPEYHSYIVD